MTQSVISNASPDHPERRFLCNAPMAILDFHHSLRSARTHRVRDEPDFRDSISIDRSRFGETNCTTLLDYHFAGGIRIAGTAQSITVNSCIE